MQVLYQVIYSLDILKDSDRSLTECKNELLKKTSVFRVTDIENEDPEIYKAHRTYVGMLTAEQTIEFLSEICAHSTCETMGAITELGWMPAISFSTDSVYDGFYDCTYISPLPMDDIPEKFNPENNIQDRLTQKFEIEPKMESLLTGLQEVLESELLASEIHFDFGQMHLDLN